MQLLTKHLVKLRTMVVTKEYNHTSRLQNYEVTHKEVCLSPTQEAASESSHSEHEFSRETSNSGYSSLLEKDDKIKTAP